VLSFRRCLAAVLVALVGPGLGSGGASGAERSGAALFARACAACHGREGRGDGPGAADLDPAPRDLSSGQYRFRSTPSGEPPLAADIERTIRRGLPGSSMPGFGSLFSDGEVEQLVAFVLALGRTAAPDTVVVPALPAATSESLEAGRNLYLLMGCWSCHGLDGGGGGPAAPALTDENGRAIRATDLRHDPLKGGRDPQDVARTLLTGLNGAPMPSYGEALLFAREDVVDLSSFEAVLPRPAFESLVSHVRASPSREGLEGLGQSGRAELQDRRLAALTHHVLSLDARRGLRHWLFEQEPDLEPRR
jgi:mono/diheme cytochrome c family protein